MWPTSQLTTKSDVTLRSVCAMKGLDDRGHPEGCGRACGSCSTSTELSSATVGGITRPSAASAIGFLFALSTESGTPALSPGGENDICVRTTGPNPSSSGVGSSHYDEASRGDHGAMELA